MLLGRKVDRLPFAIVAGADRCDVAAVIAVASMVILSSGTLVYL